MKLSKNSESSFSLKRGLGFKDVFSISTGAMISSGIFILPGLAFAKAGPSIFLSYFFAGLLALTGAFNVAELASAMPRAGGDYFFITRSMGSLVGTISGLLSWFALSLKTAFAIIGIAEILYIFTGLDFIVGAILSTIFFVILNIVGVSKAGKFEIAIVFGLLGIMTLYILGGLPKVEIMRFEPFTPNGFNFTLVTAGFVFVSYGGLLKVASISEEIKNPKRNIPLGLFTSLGVVSVLYTLMLIVTVGTLDGNVLSGSLTPIADSAQAIFGNPGYFILTFAALLAFISTGNAGILSASRYPFALGRDNLLPDFISKISHRFRTPIVSIVITGVFILISLFLKLDVLIKAASTVVILTYILSNLSIIILRESKVENYRPSFKAPLYPWMQIVGIVAFSALIMDMGWQAITISGALVLLGVIVYFAYGKKRSDGEYAFLHLIARITDKKLGTRNLESELMDILSERDELKFDRFDKLIKKATVIDIDGNPDLEEVLDSIAQTISRELEMDGQEIFELLKTREHEYSTALSPFVAVPHMVIEGEGKFDIVLVRAKEGVRFSEMYSNVRAIFVLSGTRDERTFHLQCLAAIAQIVNNPEFEELWLSAKEETSLRDMVMLSQRRRIKH